MKRFISPFAAYQPGFVLNFKLPAAPKPAPAPPPPPIYCVKQPPRQGVEL